MGLVGCVLMGAAAGPVNAGNGHDHGHGDDFVVGKTAANELEVEFDFLDVVPLAPVDGLLRGCALDDPGFASLEKDEPDEGFFVLPGGAIVVFELVAIDPGLKVHTPGFTDVLDMPGQTWVIGSPDFDVHPTWHIDSDHPSFDPDGVYSLTFRLTDQSGQCGDSEEFTVMFACAEPGACCFPDGDCEDGEFEGECEDEGGFFLGENTVCEPDVCTFGACCDEFGGCIETYGALCDGTVSQGQDCSEVTCQATRGACCDRLTGTCTETSPTACTGNVVFSLGSRCDEVSCDLAQGACCNTETGDCGITSEAGCVGDGLVWTKDADCNQVDCDLPPPFIPTTSEWGLVIMALLLICAFRIFFSGARAQRAW